MSSVAILLAPGAGAPSSSPWMQAMRQRLSVFGPVTAFDYPYQVQGRRMPDALPRLVAAHREAFEAARSTHAGPWVFAGKSMGGRVGCHVSVDVPGAAPSALICFGYPLIGQNGARREEVLARLSCPILFVQGTRDKLCPLDDLQQVRERLAAPNELHVVPEGDHSLEVTLRDMRSLGITREGIDAQIDAAIRSFLERYVLSRVGTPS